MPGMAALARNFQTIQASASAVFVDHFVFLLFAIFVGGVDKATIRTWTEVVHICSAADMRSERNLQNLLESLGREMSLQLFQSHDSLAGVIRTLAVDLEIGIVRGRRLAEIFKTLGAVYVATNQCDGVFGCRPASRARLFLRRRSFKCTPSSTAL